MAAPIASESVVAESAQRERIDRIDRIAFGVVVVGSLATFIYLYPRAFVTNDDLEWALQVQSGNVFDSAIGHAVWQGRINWIPFKLIWATAFLNSHEAWRLSAHVLGLSVVSTSIYFAVRSFLQKLAPCGGICWAICGHGPNRMATQSRFRLPTSLYYSLGNFSFLPYHTKTSAAHR